jgi:hypothetical protein
MGADGAREHCHVGSLLRAHQVTFDRLDQTIAPVASPDALFVRRDQSYTHVGSATGNPDCGLADATAAAAAQTVGMPKQLGAHSDWLGREAAKAVRRASSGQLLHRGRGRER